MNEILTKKAIEVNKRIMGVYRNRDFLTEKTYDIACPHLKDIQKEYDRSRKNKNK